MIFSQLLNKIPVLLFFLFFLFYISITAGNWWEADGMAVYQTTKSIIDHGDPSIPCYWATKAPNGNCYTQYGLFMSIIIIPFYLMDKYVLEVLKSSYFFEGFFSSLTNTVIISLIVVLIYKYLKKFKFTSFQSLLGASLFGVFSYAPAYSKTLFSEPILTLLILSDLYLLLFLKPTFKIILLAGTLFGLAFLTKIASVIVAPCILLIFICKKFPIRSYIYFALPIIFSLGIFFAYNYVRFGNILDTGYRNIKFSTPLFYGLYIHLLSPGKSFFLYQLFTIFSFFGFLRFYREQKLVFWVFGLFTLLVFIFYSIYMDPTGDLTWGSRYIYITLPFFVFSVMFFMKSYIFTRRPNSILKYTLLISLVISLLITFSSIYLSFHRYFAFLNQKLNMGKYYTYVSYEKAEYSPLLWQWKLIFHQDLDPRDSRYLRQAFQEYTTFNLDYKIAPPDLFYLRSKRELPIFILITIIELLLIKKIALLLKTSSKKS